MFPRATLAIVLLLSLAKTSTAQGLSSYLGPTLGVSSPFFRPLTRTFYSNSGEELTLSHSPIPSPIIGANGGLTIKRHLALDAALQYSYSGHVASGTVTNQPRYDTEIGIWIHKVSLPLTVGYAGDIGGKHFRLGIGGSFQYLAGGRLVASFMDVTNNVPREVRVRVNPFDETGLPIDTRRLHAFPRVSLSVVATKRLMLGGAYSYGKKRMIYIGQYFPSYFVSAGNRTLDLTVTYLLN